MMGRFLIVLCIALVVGVYGQNPVEVNFADKSPRSFNIGDTNKVFHCSINRGLGFLFTNDVNILRSNTAGGEVLLFNKQIRMEAEPTYYEDLERIDGDESTTFKFTIKEVRAEDEGQLICRVQSGDELFEDVVAININRKVEAVSLKLVDQEEPYELDVGAYPVKCVAMGSNPAVTNLKLYLDDIPVEGQLESVKMESEETRYKTTLMATVNIKAGNPSLDLDCVAEQPVDVPESESKMMTASAVIAVKTYDPVIKCTEGEAYAGLMYNPKFECSVDHAGMNIKNYKFRIENSKLNKEIELVAGDKLHDAGTAMATTTGDKTKVTLTINRADDWHFTSQFFLIVENEGGYVTKVPITLKKIPGPENSGMSLVASMVTCLLGLLAASRLRL